MTKRDQGQSARDLPPQRGGYMPQLDSIRGIAIGLVIVEHLGGPFVRVHFPLSAGALGVNLFFVLSGFLISGILFADLDRTKGDTGAVLGRFFFRRAVRLIPAYYMVLAALALADIENVRHDWLWHATYSSNFLVAAGGPMLPFWSLAVEEQFYLVLPFLLLLVSVRHRVALGVGLVAYGFLLRCLARLSGIDPTAFEVSLPGKLEVLGAGVWLGALSYARGQRVFTWLSGPAGRAFGVVAVAALLLELAIYYGSPMTGLGRYLTFTLTSAAYLGWLVVQAARGFSGWLAMAFDSLALRYVGRISYTLYLTHAFLPEFLRLPAIVARTGELPLPVLALASLVLSFAIATVSWFLFEQPLLRMAHRVTRPRAGVEPGRTVSRI